MERPTLKRLIADIEAGRVDCVVVDKVDRLSRSLLDLAQLKGKFDEHQIAFVSLDAR
jgi:site-specific DNA recombinase